MTKKYIKILSLCLAFAVVFLMIYYLSLKNLNLHISDNKKTKSISTVSKEQNSGNEDYIERSTKIVFKTIYKKSNSTVTDKSVTAGDMNILSKSELADRCKYEGYTIESISRNQIVLIKELDQFAPNKNEPNKYVLGISDGYVAIFKTDSQGYMHVEYRSDIKESILKDADKRMLTEGDLSFNTKDEAESELENYI